MRNKRPIIGITPAMEESGRAFVLSAYIRAVEESGGAPVMLPETASAEVAECCLSACDAFLITGGYDLSPSLYGEEPSVHLGPTVPERDATEMLMLPLMIKSGKPILAICRGSQLVNVYLGGSLFQDLPSEYGTAISHRQTAAGSVLTHTVKPICGTPLSRLIGEGDLAVNSLHHQAIKTLGSGLEAMATAPDGIIEATYLPSHPFLWALQWHPERSFFTDGNSERIFRHFIDAANNNEPKTKDD